VTLTALDSTAQAWQLRSAEGSAPGSNEEERVGQPRQDSTCDVGVAAPEPGSLRLRQLEARHLQKLCLGPTHRRVDSLNVGLVLRRNSLAICMMHIDLLVHS
jgi:hypothetical protein